MKHLRNIKYCVQWSHLPHKTSSPIFNYFPATFRPSLKFRGGGGPFCSENIVEFSNPRNFIHDENYKILQKWIRKYFRVSYTKFSTNDEPYMISIQKAQIVKKKFISKSHLFFWFFSKFSNIIGRFYGNFTIINF